MSDLRIAVAGVGVIGKMHLALLRANSRASACAIVDPAPAAAALAQAEGVPHYTTLEHMFAAGMRPDGMILATPNALHVAGALCCLQHGIPALIEKPLSDSLHDAQRLVAAQAESSVPLLVGHHRRHSAILHCARTAIVSGRLGQPVSFTGTALFYKPDTYFSDAPWRSQVGGGPLLINLIHEIDGMRYLLGEIDAVQAMTSNSVRHFTVEDTAAITLRFASGALGNFTLSDSAAAPRSWEQTVGENPAYPQHDDQDCYFIAGTQASLAVPTMRLWSYSAQRSWNTPFATEQLDYPRSDPLAQQLSHFCDVIEGHTAPLVTVADAAQSLRVTLAIIEAARSGALINTNAT